MGRVTKTICNGVNFVGRKAESFWDDHREEILEGLILGLACYGATELTWTLVGGRKFEHDIYKLEGQGEGFKAGQDNAVNIIAASKGKTLMSPTDTEN